MQHQSPFWIDPGDPDAPFPNVSLALREPDGLLAVGGDLGPARLLRAYRSGIFPWYNEDQPILWWSPDPRMVLPPTELKVSRSLRKTLRRGEFDFTLDHAFRTVIEACAAPRDGATGTWLTRDMIEAYVHLHELGHAHSAEAWHAGKLVGGLYGVAIGGAFFGESMFTRKRDASKAAFATLVHQLEKWGFSLIDCQVHTDHLASLGARCIAREDFIHLIRRACEVPTSIGRWELESGL